MSVQNIIDNKTLIKDLISQLGSQHVLTSPAKTARYRKGFRSGQGDALAVVFLVHYLSYGVYSASA